MLPVLCPAASDLLLVVPYIYIHNSVLEPLSFSMVLTKAGSVLLKLLVHVAMVTFITILFFSVLLLLCVLLIQRMINDL